MFVTVIPKDIEIMFRFSPEELGHLISVLSISKLSFDESKLPDDAVKTLTGFITAMSDVQKGLTDGA
jgi:hypothetical protein